MASACEFLKRCESGDSYWWWPVDTYVTNNPDCFSYSHTTTSLTDCNAALIGTEEENCSSGSRISFTKFMEQTNNYETPFIHRNTKEGPICQLQDLFPNPCPDGQYYNGDDKLCKPLKTQCDSDLKILLPTGGGYNDHECGFKTDCVNRDNETIGTDYYYDAPSSTCIDQTPSSCSDIDGQPLKTLVSGSTTTANECVFKDGCDNRNNETIGTDYYYDATSGTCIDQPPSSCSDIDGQPLKTLVSGSPTTANECVFKNGCDNRDNETIGTDYYYDAPSDTCTKFTICNSNQIQTVEPTATSDRECYMKSSWWI